MSTLAHLTRTRLPRRSLVSARRWRVVWPGRQRPVTRLHAFELGAPDTTTVTFANKGDGKPVPEVACKGAAMPAKADTTVMSTSADKNGVRMLDKL